MTSKLDKRSIGKIIKDFNEARPKTPHEEIMFCIESTNETLLHLVEHMKKCCKHCHYEKQCGEKLSDSL